jgi:hypothetical protein
VNFRLYNILETYSLLCCNLVEQGPLSRNEIVSSLVCLVFIPYVKQKLDNLYEEASGSALADMFFQGQVRKNWQCSHQEYNSSLGVERSTAFDVEDCIC